MSTTTVTFNDRIGSRSLSHMNVLVASVGDQTVIFPFEGKPVPGVVQIVSTRYEKNGKWSYTEWTAELADGIRSFEWYQNWETSQYLNAGVWSRAVEDVRRFASIPDLDAEAIERFVRARLPVKAKALDAALVASAADPTPALLDLLRAQEELAASSKEEAAIRQEVALAEQAAQARSEAAAIRERVANAKAAMKRGASLADLKALLS